MPETNLLQLLQNTVQAKPREVCFRYKDDHQWKVLYWNEVYQKVLDLAGGLKKLGVKKGDRIAIFSRTRYEWTVADMAILACGAITVPIYESSIADQVSYILRNSAAKIVFVEDPAQLKKIKAIAEEIPHVSQAIVFDTYDKPFAQEEGVYLMDEVMLLGAGTGHETFEEMAKKLDENSEASFVYTSGTTGPPKGAILTHGNFLSELFALRQMVDFSEGIESLLFLPLAHIFARVVQFAQMHNGFVQIYAESIDKLLDNIAEMKPHLLTSVPRIFEKVHGKVMQGVEASTPTKQKIFHWAMKIGSKRAECIHGGKTVPRGIRLAWPLAYALVFSKLHAKMGGRIVYFISGGAPLSKDIGNFFHAAGFLILEGYGLTETSAAITVNSPTAVKIGTVGRPLPGVEIQIATDGEILVRGGVVFKGYYQLPEETKNAIDEAGWFHTGDIGVIDEDGFLKITDRKKDIIVTAAGKNIAPQNLENLIKTDPMISQVMVHGDQRKFLSALITLNPEEIIRYAKSHQIAFENYGELVKNEKIYHFIKERLDAFNKHLAKYETIKKFAILDQDFSIESGELTPTLKVKRKFTSEKYKYILDQFYQEHGGE